MRDPRYYLYSYSREYWVECTAREADAAFDMGIFSVEWPYKKRPNGHFYDYLIKKAYHLAADSASNNDNMQLRNVFKKG